MIKRRGEERQEKGVKTKGKEKPITSGVFIMI